MSDSWAEYLTRGAFNRDHSHIIYHLTEVNVYEHQLPSGNYIPPTFETDGNFTHATEDPSMLIAVANHFYQSSKSDWICLEIDPRFLGCAVVYEAAASVGDTPPMPWTKPGDVFPHIYGKIPTLAVTKIFKVNRNEKGEFLNIEGL
eukprot:gene15343-17160_t